jgi:hypothetical protein
MRVFSIKQTAPFFIQTKKPTTKKQQGYLLFNFPRSLHHTFFDNSTFIAEASVWLRWKGILLSKIRKIKKPATTIFS